MKKTFFLSALLTLTLVSCKENTAKTTVETEEQPTIEKTNSESSDVEEYKVFTQDKIDEMNKVIVEEKITDHNAIFERFFPKDNEAEGNYSYQKRIVIEDNKHIVIEIIEDGIMDDSIQAIRTFMSIDKSKATPVITEVRQSFKCKLNRGQQEWSAALCM